MKSHHARLLFTIAAAILLSICVQADAQQGWSRAQVIKQDGKDATVNAVYYDGDEIWVVGAEGLISRSYDDGRSFNEVRIGIAEGLNDVFVRRERVWIVGDAGVILLSTDGGGTFIRNLYAARRSRSNQQGGRPAPLDLYSVQFTDNENGFIVGDEGLILGSTDGGYSWRELRSSVDNQLFHLSVRGRFAWVVGTGGTILHTDDGGKTWYPQRSGVSDDLNRVYMVNNRVGLITGDNGIVLRTENGGISWSRSQVSVREPLFGISYIDRDTGWVVGYKGTVIRTYDGGRNWVEQVSGTDVDLFSVSFQKNRGYAVGRDGLLLRYFEKR
ncbi:MAG TPA: YCF48-related protein [Blastocatellia bacterium]|nr:YCF48-related protein [Blastocatellia bacterium]